MAEARKLKLVTGPVLNETPAPSTIPGELSPEQVAVRVGNRLRYEAMASDSGAQLKRLAALDVDYIIAVCALIDLFAYEETQEDDTNNTNWLGGFMFGVLHTMTWEGPEEANRQPHSVRELLNGVLENLEDDLQKCRRMVKVYQGVFEEAQEDSAPSAV